MLQKLYISNYALIDEISVDFSNGFSVITGETGAGKSIVLGAIQILMGARTSVKLLKDKSTKSIIEGVFNSNEKVNDALVKLNLDISEDIIFRREIKPNGSSRAFINDSPVKVDQLKLLSQYIIELNGQYLIHDIGKVEFNYEFVNDFIKNKQILQEYDDSYSNYVLYSKKHDDIVKNVNLLNEKRDFLKFQLDELSGYSFDEWDEEIINNEYNLIANQEEINKRFDTVNALLSSDNGVLSNLATIGDEIEHLNLKIKDLATYVERFNSVRIELEDIFHELNKKYNFQSTNPNKLKELEELINHINFLLKKFNVVDLSSLKEKRNNIQLEISKMDDLNSDLDDCKLKKDYWMNKSLLIAENLLELRKDSFEFIEKEVNSILKSISMDHASFKLHIEKTNQLSPNGIDSIDFLISVNNRKEYFPIHKFSSGGELSRIALALKYVSSNSNSKSVLIFDEIDSGVSGKVASEVGLLLRDISKKVQVINITHLPQVAALGKVHFHVEKKDYGNGIESKLVELKREERIQELAKMLGGDKTGNAAINNALELLN
ncbi:MAG: hypothetical protein CL848_01495 [Crocinitomicaceae bacterium]|nr:hypothetical protein [Crocinitomicaceae bacterium]